jgi:hypothetical protein
MTVVTMPTTGYVIVVLQTVRELEKELTTYTIAIGGCVLNVKAQVYGIAIGISLRLMEKC